MLLSNYRLAKSIGKVLKPVAAMAVPFAVQLSTPPAFAVVIRGFSGDFAPAQWSETSTDSAFVDASLVPDQLTLKSPDGGSGDPESFTYAIALPAENYSLGFRWLFSTDDTSPANDLFGYSLNGGPLINLADPLGGLSQTGYIKITAAPGDLYAFAMDSSDNLGGRSTVMIRSFIAGLASEVPDCDCVSVPSPLPLLGAASFLRWSRVLRKRSRIAALPATISPNIQVS